MPIVQEKKIHIVSVVIAGEEASGKTQLRTMLTNEAAIFDPKHRPTRTADFSYIGKCVSNHDFTVQIFEDAGKAACLDATIRHADRYAICVDLSKALLDSVIRQTELLETITHAKKINPRINIILIGTKSELDEDARHFGELEEFLFAQDVNLPVYAVSCKNKLGLKAVCEQMIDVPIREYLEKAKSQENKIPVCSPFEQAVLRLRQAIVSLPNKKKKKVEENLAILESVLGSDVLPYTFKKRAIEAFQQRTLTVLQGDHPIAAKAILTVVVVAIVTLLALLIGFGLGVAAGAWTGPAGFMTGVIAGSAAAMRVFALAGVAALLSGTLTSYSFFKKPEKELYAFEQSAVGCFTRTVEAAAARQAGETLPAPKLVL